MTGYLSIGEFARATGLSVSAVRFYADRGLLSPAHVDGSSGYRSFLPSQVHAACLIRDLRQIDMSLADVEAALAMDQAAVARLVANHADGLEAGVRRARNIADSFAAAAGSRAATALVRGSDLCDAIDQVLPFAATDPELPHLLTVRIEAKDGSVRLVATDTHRLAVRDLVPEQLSGEFAGLIAAATLADMRSAFGSAGHVTISTDMKQLTIGHKDGTATARLIPAIFPDYERFLTPHDDIAAFVVDKTELANALEAIASSDVAGAAAAHLTSSPGGLKLSGGEITIELSALGASGLTVDIFIDPSLGQDCVRGAIGSEVAVEIPVDVGEPVVFRSATNGTYTSFLMPIKR